MGKMKEFLMEMANYFPQALMIVVIVYLLFMVMCWADKALKKIRGKMLETPPQADRRWRIGHYRVVFYWECQGKAGFAEHIFWSIQGRYTSHHELWDWTQSLRERYGVEHVVIIEWKLMRGIDLDPHDALVLIEEIGLGQDLTARNVAYLNHTPGGLK